MTDFGRKFLLTPVLWCAFCQSLPIILIPGLVELQTVVKNAQNLEELPKMIVQKINKI
jgi:hypothetical protein